MKQLVIAPMLVALVTAVATLATSQWARIRSIISLAGGVGYLLAVGLLLTTVWHQGAIAYQLSSWPAPYGITLVVDALSGFFLALAATVGLGTLVFGLRSISEIGQRLSYHPLHHFVLVGVSGAFLTGDLFNLFVWFEVMLMASYVLVAFQGDSTGTRAALTYVVLNLIGSAIMLVAIGGLYALTGTLNLADMTRRLADPMSYGIDIAPVLGLSVLLFGVFALKSGVVPVHFWVAPAYRAAPAPVAALLAGVVKKVGLYAMIRLYFTVFGVATLPIAFPGLDGSTVLAFYGPVLFLIAIASIFIGGLSALASDDLDGLLAYSSISQVGFIIMALAIGAGFPAVRELAVAAALIYSLHHGIAKPLLFLASGAIYETIGTVRFADLGGLAGRTPYLSGSFFVGALALIGIPPLFGFFGKFYIFDTLLRGGAGIALALTLLGAIITIAYLTQAWNRGFWGSPGDAVLEANPRRDLTLVVVVFAVTILALGIGIDPIAQWAQRGAEAALDRSGYIETVLGDSP